MPVDIKRLTESIVEAERFLSRAKVCLKDMQRVKMANAKKEFDDLFDFYDTRLSAGVRRSSMDLTRALAQLRKT